MKINLRNKHGRNARAIACQIGLVITLCMPGFFTPALAGEAPRIFYTDIESGPNTGGENNNGAYLSIFGKGFGVDLSKIKVTVGDGEVVRYMYLGPSLGRPDVQQLSVQLGPATSTGPIKVAVNGVVSNTDHSFTVRPGNFYFLSPTGNDNKGKVNEISRPFRSPNYIKGLGAFKAGDFIIARGGKYVLADDNSNIGANTWLRADKSGMANAPLAFLGYPGEDVDVHHSDNIKIFSNYVSIAHWVVGNFKVTLTDCVGAGEILALGATTTPSVCKDANGTQQGKVSFTKVVNIEADGHDKAGFCSGGDGLIEISYSEGVKVLGVALHNTSPARGDNESAHAIYLSTRQKGTEVGWNAIYNIPATRAVIQVYQDSFGGTCWGTKQLTDIKIHDNLLHDLAGQAILLDGGTGDIEVYNNVLYNHKDHRYEDAISLRGSGGKLNAKLYNNTVYVNPNQASPGWILGIGSYMGNHCPESVTLYNNIFIVTETQDLYHYNEAGKSCVASITSDHNIWYGSKNPKPAFTGPNELNADPKFINPGTGDFRLRRDSPAIGKGSARVSPVVSHDHDMVPWTKEKGYDMGAYQHQPAVE